ncbi:phospholipase D-like domain-containing protein [Marinospirillum perlucidum]|uniref:phospholipase D-like domain-containing protein n=1 Tax=Marinospirillum perlucidum TaxID=1982602 RepID=UPI001FE83CAC|nr:phosphatidylserine/phosphatidylglycerophosphate/cardiolipin synthase family protein [Marinospirillum perlucidum]
MLAEIDRAQEYVLLEVYLVASGEQSRLWIKHLVAAVQRGVQVVVLFDDFGAAELLPEDLQRLQTAGIRLKRFNPLHWRKVSRNLMRDHRKLLLVDGRTAFTGGFGLTDEFCASSNAWYELVIRLQGPCVADWERLFWQTWRQAHGRPRLKASSRKPRPVTTGPQAGTSEGRLVTGQGVYLHGIKLSLLRQIHRARQRIWLTTPYFVPSYRLRQALIAAARRGVEVHLLLPGPRTDHPPVRFAGQRFYSRLLKAGVHIYEYQPSFIHAKVSLCDDWISIGSCNFDHWGIRWNLEANQEILDPAVAGQVLEWFETTRLDCLWLDPQLWEERSRWQRIREYLWGLVDALAQRLR